MFHHFYYSEIGGVQSASEDNNSDDEKSDVDPANEPEPDVFMELETGATGKFLFWMHTFVSLMIIK